MDESPLYFGGYRKPEAGDYILAYRHDACIGWIMWSTKGDNECLWSLAFGGQHHKGLAYGIDTAKNEIVAAFMSTCGSMDLRIEGASKKPKAEDIDWVGMLISEVKSKATTAELDSYMNSRDVKRRLKEMVRLERTQVLHEAERHFKVLYDKEHPEEGPPDA